MRIFEVTDPNKIVKLKSKIMRAMNNLDLSDPANQSLLIDLKGLLHRHHIVPHLEKTGLKQRIADYEPKILKSGEISQSKTEQDKKKKAEAVWNWLTKEFKGLEGIELNDKINFMNHLKRGSGINPNIFKKSSSGTLLDQVDSGLRKTKTFQEIRKIMWEKKESGQGGMGPGELFIIALTPGAKKGGGANDPDIVIDGTYKVELKLGGIVPFGSGGSNNIIDKLNNDLITTATEDGIVGHLGNIEYTDSKAGGKGALAPIGVSVESGWFPQLFNRYKEQDPSKGEKLFNNYFDKLYDGQIPTKIIKSLYINLGIPGAERILAPTVFRQYQKDKGFDSLCVIDENFKYVNMTKEDIQSDNFEVPTELGLTLKMIKGGDTNAVKDGYYFVGIGKNPVVSDDGPESLDDLDINPKVEQPKKDSEKDPKKQQSPKIDKPEKDPKKQQNPNLTYDPENTEGTLSSKLANPLNPITIAWEQLKQLSPKELTSAQEEIVNLIKAGKPDKEIAQEVEKYVYESQIRRMKQLIG